MARITVEDCTRKLKNKFALVAIAAQRARSIYHGSPPVVEIRGDRIPVIALREIAAGALDTEQIRNELIQNLQTRNKIDIIEDENLHAENQETMLEEFGGLEDDISMFEETDDSEMSLDSHSFDDNIEEDR